MFLHFCFRCFHFHRAAGSRLRISRKLQKKPQHCCCRGCLNKWYKVPMHKELTETEQQKIINLLMAWIERQNNKGISNTNN
ncbi:MAG: DUF4186 family protein [Clostridia bacterium]|nr:DUF4186 family protein [Clostridia bacterium]